MNTKNNTGKKVSEELEANRLSLYIILAFVCLVGLVYLYRAVDSVHYISFFNRCVQWIIWLSAALVALSLWRVAASRGKDVSGKLLTPGTGLFLSVLALLSGLFLKMYYNDAIKLLYILIPGLCVVYLIKLMGSVHKLETFYINTRGTYTVQRIVPLAVGRGGSVSYTKNSREKPLPEVDWYGGEEPDWTKNDIPIFLFCPAPMEIRVIRGEAKKESPLIGSGAIGDAYMESLKKRRLTSHRQVFLLTVDGQGSVFCVKKEAP